MANSNALVSVMPVAGAFCDTLANQGSFFVTKNFLLDFKLASGDAVTLAKNV